MAQVTVNNEVTISSKGETIITSIAPTSPSDIPTVIAGNGNLSPDLKRPIVIKTEEVETSCGQNFFSVMNPDDGVHYQCSECTEVYVNESDLNNHLISNHQVIITKTSPNERNSSALITRCPFCKSSVRDLPEHLLTAHPEKLIAAPATSPPSSDSTIPIFLPRQPVPPSQLSPIDSATPTGVTKKFPPLSIEKVKSEEVNLLLTVGSAPTSRPSSPIRHFRTNTGTNESFPMNLSVRRINNAASSNGSTGANTNGRRTNNYIRNSRSAPVSDEDSGNDNNNGEAGRKRRKQTHVPDQNKDERYWARRLKNNEAAKRSRDMRIKRERVVFEENAKLEKENQELKNGLESLRMENKELHLKMGLILDENERLKALLVKSENETTNEDSNSTSSSSSSNVNVITLTTTSTTNGNQIRAGNKDIKHIYNKSTKKS